MCTEVDGSASCLLDLPQKLRMIWWLLSDMWVLNNSCQCALDTDYNCNQKKSDSNLLMKQNANFQAGITQV